MFKIIDKLSNKLLLPLVDKVTKPVNNDLSSFRLIQVFRVSKYFMDDLLSNQYCFECGCFDSYGIQDSNEGIEAFGDRVANQEIKTDN